MADAEGTTGTNVSLAKAVNPVVPESQIAHVLASVLEAVVANGAPIDTSEELGA